MEPLTTRIIRPSRNLHLHHRYSLFPAPSAEHCASRKLNFRHSVLILLARAPARTWNLILPEGSQARRMAPPWGWFACVREPFDWIGPILRSSPARTAYFSHRLLRRLLRHSLFPRFLMREICGPGRRKFASSIASSCRKLRAFPYKAEFSIHSQVILRRTLTSAFRPGAKCRASPLMPREFPSANACSDRILR